MNRKSHERVKRMRETMSGRLGAGLQRISLDSFNDQALFHPQQRRGKEQYDGFATVTGMMKYAVERKTRHPRTASSVTPRTVHSYLNGKDIDSLVEDVISSRYKAPLRIFIGESSFVRAAKAKRRITSARSFQPCPFMSTQGDKIIKSIKSLLQDKQNIIPDQPSRVTQAKLMQRPLTSRDRYKHIDTERKLRNKSQLSRKTYQAETLKPWDTIDDQF